MPVPGGGLHQEPATSLVADPPDQADPSLGPGTPHPGPGTPHPGPGTPQDQASPRTRPPRTRHPPPVNRITDAWKRSCSYPTGWSSFWWQHCFSLCWWCRRRQLGWIWLLHHRMGWRRYIAFFSQLLLVENTVWIQCRKTLTVISKCCSQRFMVLFISIILTRLG